MLLRHVIGAVLRRIRLGEGRTLREVSLAANISMPYLSEIERGRKEPSSEILAGICSALGMTLVDLLQEARAEMLSDQTLTAGMNVVDLTAPRAPLSALAPVRMIEPARSGVVLAAA
jgi:transcriptional regulator with XRE-family HTH domain